MTFRSLLVAATLCGLAFGTAARAESSFEQEIRLLTEMLQLGPGKRVADIGAGEGEYALAIAGVVGETGSVLATELDPERLAALEERARELPQLRAVEGQVDTTGLAPASVDAAFLRDVYHHITAPEPFLADLYQALRPGGRLVLIDFPPTFWLALWTPEGIPESRGGHGITTGLLIQEAEAAGFVPIRTVEEWPSSNFITKTYGVAFERPDAP